MTILDSDPDSDPGFRDPDVGTLDPDPRIATKLPLFQSPAAAEAALRIPVTNELCLLYACVTV